MEKAFAKVEELADTIKAYADIRIESFKLNAAEKSSAVLANLLAALAAAFFFIFFLSLASISLSVFLNEWIGKPWVGFLIVAGFYLIIGIVLWAAKGRIIRMPVMNAIIKQLFMNHDEHN